jgi:hypothetical protein
MIVLILQEAGDSDARRLRASSFAVGLRAILGRNRSRKLTVRGHGSFTGGTSSDMAPPPSEGSAPLPNRFRWENNPEPGK